GRVPRQRLEQSNLRLEALADRFAHPAEDLLASLGGAEHQTLAKGLASTSSGWDPTERSKVEA
ncbi:MAG TPA: beta-N-acetylhexosaminidase, partial [Myxococcaceae bacterium]|nr:beta-N-acetylhexosaminidase [Myxococcaceae bacterium]